MDVPSTQESTFLAECRFFLSGLRDQRTLLYRGLILLALGSGLQLLYPIGAGRLVDGTLGYGQPGWEQIHRICLGLLGVIFVIIFLKYWETCWFQEAGERAVADLRKRVFSHLVRLPLAWYGPRRSAEISSRLLADLAQVQELWIFDLRQLAISGSVLLGCLVMLVITSWQLCVAACFAIPPCIVLAAWVGPRIRRSGSQAQEALAASANIVQDALQAMPMVKGFLAEEQESQRYGNSLQGYLQAALRGSRQRAVLVSFIMLFILSAYVFVMWKGSLMVRGGQLTPGGFTAFMFYLGFSATSAGFLAETFTKVQRALGAYGRVREILLADQERLETREVTLAFAQQPIRFCNVAFSYPSRTDTAALHGVDLIFPPGQCTALVGGSGAGKSTVAALLGRLYAPQQGTIYLGETAVESIPLANYRSRLAYVPQEVLLFGGSIAENIAFGKPGATPQEIREAAQLAQADAFIAAFPQGYETRVGDRGAQLSGGQRQRIAIARALLVNPAILILDEATSALDTESEAQVQAALTQARAGRTTIIIAHRKTTIQNADHVIVLRDGKVVETGTPKELSAQRGEFYYLFGELG